MPHCPTSLRSEKFWAVARADLKDVGVLRDDAHLVRLEHLGHDGEPGLLARLGEQPEPLLLEPLERVGRGARLERSAAQQVGASRS